MARNRNSWAAIWWPASWAVPTRLAAAVATASVARRKRGPLHEVGADLQHRPHHRRHHAEAVEAIGAQAGYDDGEDHGAPRTWATTVPHALPAIPQSRPKTSSSSRTRLAAVAKREDEERPLGVGEAVEVADARDRDELERHADHADAAGR